MYVIVTAANGGYTVVSPCIGTALRTALSMAPAVQRCIRADGVWNLTVTKKNKGNNHG